MKSVISLLLLFLPLQSIIAQDDLDSLITALENSLEKRKIPAVMISIVRGDSILFADAIGYADIHTKEEATAAHLFRQASISKSFTSLALLHLLHDHPFGLSTPIREVDPKIPFSNKWGKEAAVTIENLLEHTSGFDDFHMNAIYNKTDSVTPPTEKVIYAHRKSLDSRWKPGTRMAYSNSGYVVAGHVLEKLAKQRYNEYIKEQILLPLGMKKSGFYFKEPTQFPMVKGYEYKYKEYRELPFYSIQGGPAGDFCANAEEMARYLQFMLNRKATGVDSLVFTEEVFDRIENAKTTLASKNGLPAGYGLGNSSFWRNGFLFHGHTGGIDGFSTRYSYSRAADLGIAIAINQQREARDILAIFLDFLLEKQTEPLLGRTVLPIPEKLKQQYEGFYTFHSSRQKLFSFLDRMINGFSLEFQGDKVLVTDLRGAVLDSLHYAGDHQFYKNIEGVPTAIALPSEDGKTAFWVKGKYAEKEALSLRWAYIGISLFALSVPFLFMAYFGIWFLIWLFSKQRKPLLNHALLFAACFSYFLMFFFFAMTGLDRRTTGDFTVFSAGLFVSSLLLVLLTGLSIWRWFKLPPSKVLRFVFGITILALCILIAYYWANGFIGLRLWAY